ncbi:Zinc finger BED domain-containing protein 5 [Eumeta japonica]|uniref:Zinc finger BED domain-containing protein 5 n=1 Tax=Eumeta variegata TaxID=151549 RepID=A0A4C1YTV4_EUMVA|nr:Zinc finger BED domain-containing protein 5 [Eumeta japonica]
MERWLRGVKHVATSNDAECSRAVRAENPELPIQTMMPRFKLHGFKDEKVVGESYISFGFVDSNGSHLCMLCSKLLPNSSTAPAKLRRHLKTVHPESKDKNKDFFVHKKEQLLESQKI